MTHEQHMERLANIMKQLEEAHAAMVADDYLDSYEFLDENGGEPDQLKQVITNLDEFIFDNTQVD